MTDDEFVETIFPKIDNDNEELQPKPDCEMMYKELQKPGVTRTLLWEKYSREVKAVGKIPLQYSQFYNYFNHYLKINKATMHFEYKIVERIEVDWCGTTVPIVNNLTGVVKHPKDDDVILNKAYEEMGDYYNIAIVPTLPKSPKGKPNVEGIVGKITTHIIARLRHEEFHSINEENDKNRKCLYNFNNKGFQKRNDIGAEVFLNKEKPFLRQLPEDPYEYAT